MSKKQESLKAELQKVLSRGGRAVVSKSSDGKAVPVPEEAEVFEFEFTKDGEGYGKVFVSIDGLHQLIIYFDETVANSPKNGSADSESWEQLVRTLKRFAMMKQLSFKLTDMDNLENDMAKREHTKRQEKMYEGYHAQGKKASYSDNVPSTKIIIKHKREMQEGEQRFRQIDKIFIENMIGERMLAPTDKPGLARVFARHIAEGGKANDERWNHITGLCEEYQKMAGFVRATRNSQFNESAQKLVTEGVNHYLKLRESLGKMSGQRGYNAYFESYTPSLMEDEESVDLSEMFMSNSLDPRIESVMPILSKLSKNITETSDMEETIALEAWADNIIGTHKGGTVTRKDGVTKHQSGPGVYGGYDDSTDPDSPEEKHTEKRGAKTGHRTDKVAARKVDEVDAPKSGKPSNKEVANRMHSILSNGKEGGEKGRQWSNKDMERLRIATRDFDDIMASDGPDQTKHDLIKKQIQTKPMAGPKGVLPEQGVAEANIQQTSAGSRSHISNLSHPTTNSVTHPSSGKEIGLITMQSDGKYYAHPSSVKLSHNQGGVFDTKEQAHQYIRDAHAKAIKTGTLSDRWKKSELLPQFAKEQGVAEDLDPEQKSAGQFSPKDKFARPGDLVGASESVDPLIRLKKLLGK